MRLNEHVWGPEGALRSSASTASARTGCASGASRRSTSPTASECRRSTSVATAAPAGSRRGRSTSTSRTCSRPSTGRDLDRAQLRRTAHGGDHGAAAGPGQRAVLLDPALWVPPDVAEEIARGELAKAPFDSPEDALRPARQASSTRRPSSSRRSSASTWWSSPTAAGSTATPRRRSRPPTGDGHVPASLGLASRADAPRRGRARQARERRRARALPQGARGPPPRSRSCRAGTSSSGTPTRRPWRRSTTSWPPRGCERRRRWRPARPRARPSRCRGRGSG